MTNTDRFVILRDTNHGVAVQSDETGRIPLLATAPLAAAFADERKRRTGAEVAAYLRTSRQNAELLVRHGLDDTHVYDVEAQASSFEAALAWSRELAQRAAKAVSRRPEGSGQ